MPVVQRLFISPAFQANTHTGPVASGRRLLSLESPESHNSFGQNGQLSPSATAVRTILVKDSTSVSASGDTSTSSEELALQGPSAAVPARRRIIADDLEVTSVSVPT